MIRNDREYKEAVNRLKNEGTRLEATRAALEKEGRSAEEIKRLTDPVVSFHLQLQEEVEAYERLKRRDFGELRNLDGLGRMLVGLRIALGLTQRELAHRLEVDESQVSRDERNEYHGISVERVTDILNALKVNLTSSIEELPAPDEGSSSSAEAC